MARLESLYVLLGPSGAGKTTIADYIIEKTGADRARKYTTRPSRQTPEDARDFIFQPLARFPSEGVLVFESYGHHFGIQLVEIDRSLTLGRSHVLTVGDVRTLAELRLLYGTRVVGISVYCSADVLRRRVEDPGSLRAHRWAQIQAELAESHTQLRHVDHTVDNSGALDTTLRRVDALITKA